MVIIAINHFVIIINFCNHFDKVLTEIFQFRRALTCTYSIVHVQLKTYQNEVLSKHFQKTLDKTDVALTGGQTLDFAQSRKNIKVY